MDKLRGFLNPGKDKDDEALYGSGSQAGSSEPTSAHTGNTGNLTGQGSHLSGVGADSSAPSVTQTVGSSGPTGADTTRSTDRTDNTSAASMKSGVLGNDPRTTSNVTGDNQSSVNTAGPAGSGAGVAASRAWQQHEGRQGTEEHIPGSFPSDTNNPYKTSNLDPRVDSGNRASTTQSTNTPQQPATKSDYGGPRSTGNYGGGAGALPEYEKRAIQNTPGHSGHHTGRDAGLAAGGAALGAHEYEKHKDRDTSNTGNYGNTGNTGNTYPSSTSSNTGNTGNNYPSSTSNTTGGESGHHYGRDAGLGAGGAALGAHEYEKHNNRDTSNTGNNYPSSTSNTSGAPGTNTGTSGYEPSSNQYSNTGAGNTTGPAGHDTSARETNRMATDTTNDNQSNQGSGIGNKVAGALAGGAAAVGLTKHEENKHDDKAAEERGTQGGSNGEDFHTPNTVAGAASDKPHGKDVSRTVHPTHGSARAPSFLGHLTGETSSDVTGASGQTADQGSHHHAGRDAEDVAAGAGAAGVAEHEARKHHHPESSRDQTTRGPTDFNTTGGQHPGISGSTNQQPEHEHHYGRDAGIGAGAAGLGGVAYEAERHHHQPTDSRQTGQTGQQLPMRDQTSQQYPAGTTTQQGTQPHDQHHYGRDAGIGAGAAGLGGAAYEAERHRHEPRQPTQPTEPRAPVQPKEPTPTYYGAATTERDPSQVQAYNEPHREHHLGRDAAAGTAVGAGAGALGYEAEHGRHHPHDSATRPYDSQSYDPQSTRSQGTTRPYETGNTTAPGSTTQQPGNEHHYGRDAALGAGAAGLGGAAYEHHKHGDQTGHSSQTQAYQQPEHDRHLGRDAAAGTAAETGAGALASDRSRHDAGQGYAQQSQQSQQPETEHHYGRDAALGAGAAGLGGAAYEHHKKDEQRDYPSQTQQGQQYQQPEHDRHLGRDAAAGTAAGVGAGAAGHELSKHEAEKQQKAHEKELVKEQKHDEKELAKEHKAEEKAYQKEIAKEHKAQEKAHEKAIAKEEKHHHKDEKHHEKEAAAAAAAEEKEKKPSLLDRILHRHKDDETTDETTGDYHRGEEAAGAGAVGAAGVGAYEYDKHHGRGAMHDNDNSTEGIEHQKHGRNVLHKDPPAGYQQDANRVEYEDAPTKGYASQVTGGTGTTALAKGNELPSGSHLSTAGNRADPAVADRASTVTEPITGLPMDLNKGTGVGGTDSGPQSGYRQ